MAIISLCGAVGRNTGEIDCDPVRGNPVKIMLGSSTFLAADYADSPTLKIAFVNRMKRGAGDPEKLFPLPVIQGTTDKTVAAKEGTLGYGLTFKLQRGKPGYEFDVVAGSTLEKKLMAFDKKQMPVFIYDDAAQIWAKQDSSGSFIGVKYLVGVEPRPHGDASNAKVTKVSISIVDAQDFVENASVFLSDFSVSDLVGLKDVTLSEPSAHSTNVYKIKMTIPTVILNSPINIYDAFAALIAAMTFTAGTGVNFGTSMPVTSVAVDATNKCLTVTLDSTAYGLLSAGDKIKLTPPSVTTLDTGNVTGIEISPIILTK